MLAAAAVACQLPKLYRADSQATHMCLCCVQFRPVLELKEASALPAAWCMVWQNEHSCMLHKVQSCRQTTCMACGWHQASCFGCPYGEHSCREDNGLSTAIFAALFALLTQLLLLHRLLPLEA